jgi:predicted Na+-dependent transporter
MVFHQIQLMVCAVMAQHYARRDDPPVEQPIPADTPAS